MGTRRRNGLLGTVLIASVALAVIVVPHFISSSPVTNGDTGPAEGVTHRGADGVPDPLAYPCPSAAIAVNAGSLSAADVAVDAGAVSIRICPAFDPEEGFSRAGTYSDFAAPADALTVGIAGFYESMTTLGRPSFGCPLILPAPDPIAIVVRYDDGSTHTYAVRDTYCRAAVVDGQEHSLAEVLAAYQVALAAQREALTPPHVDTTGLSCARPDTVQSFIDPGKRLGLVAAVICRVPKVIAPLPAHAAAKPLIPRIVDDVDADVAWYSFDHRPRVACVEHGWTYIVGVNAWGDHAYISDEGCSGLYRFRDLYWDPPVVIDAELARAGQHAVELQRE